MKRIKLDMSKSEFEEFLPVHALRSLNVDGLDICFARTNQGVYAFKNSCPHYSVPLDTGRLNSFNEVICSLHAYRYNLEDGWEADGKNYCLTKYEVEIEGEEVYVLSK